MGKYLNGKELQQALFKRTEGYAANVRSIYQKAFEEIIDIVKGTELEDGVPFSFSGYGYTDEVQPIIRRLYSQTYQTIRGGVQKEWLFSSENNDELVKAVFGKHAIENNHFAKYFLRNREAMDVFFARKTEGLDLSQKVWRYTSQYKEELEKTLDLAIGEGTPANRLATKVQEYLQDPDRWYRHFRIKIGEKEDGTPIYGSKWKRRIFDKEDGIYKWIDDNPKAYHPGRGVYRSSYRNAQRLARSETNIAYRTADYERWAELDFIVGVEIKTSNNHPEPDICDELKGIYPKDFKWTGWHPNCRCYMVPVIAPQDDIDKMLESIMDGEEPGKLSVEPSNEVDKMPEEFTRWINSPKTQARMEQAKANGTMPYFIRDNEKLLNPSKETPVDIAKARHNARTPEDIEAIQKAWDFRKDTIKVSRDVLGKLEGISDVDLTELQEALKTADYRQANELAKALQEKVAQLESLKYIDNPFDVAKQFSMKAAVGVENAVSSKLAEWAGLSLEEQVHKLEFEVFKFFDGNMNGVQQKYATWQVSRNAYYKQLLAVQDQLFWKNANLATAEFTGFKTKSKIYDDLLAKLVDSISQKDKDAYQSTIEKLKVKKAELEAAASKRTMKKSQALANGQYRTTFGPEELSQARKNSAVWESNQEKVDSICRGETERVWKTATHEEKLAATKYTEGSGGCNRPLRGYDGSWSNYVGVGNVSLNNEGRENEIHALTALIDRSKSQADMWMNRGIETIQGTSGFVGIPQATLRRMISSGDVSSLVGREVVDTGFISCGTAKGTGFRGTIVNIYAPKGTKMIYAEPFSYFNGDSCCSSGTMWDGIGKYEFRREFETIIQRGTKFRITRAYVEYGNLYLDVDVIAQI